MKESSLPLPGVCHNGPEEARVKCTTLVALASSGPLRPEGNQAVKKGYAAGRQSASSVCLKMLRTFFINCVFGGSGTLAPRNWVHVREPKKKEQVLGKSP